MRSSKATIPPRTEQVGCIAEEKDIKICTTSTNLSVEDDFNGISITSLAKSLVKNKTMPQSIEGYRPTLVQRKLHVSHPDPRPVGPCSWCGCGKDDALCPICDMLRENGWSSYQTTDKNFRDHNNEKIRCVKNFLIASTAYVVKAMGAMSHQDRLRLLKQYEEADSSNEHNYTPKRKGDRLEPEISLVESYTPKGVKGITIELPSITQLLSQENGLEGVLRADVHSVYNLHFGTNATIAAKILLTLGKGDFPTEVENEVPFLRSNQAVQELSKGSSTVAASRFVGVFRVVGDEQFAVGVPVFHVEQTSNGSVPPKEATVNNGQICLVRIGIADENTAAKLFAFMYRILYGSKASLDALKDQV